MEIRINNALRSFHNNTAIKTRAIILLHMGHKSPDIAKKTVLSYGEAVERIELKTKINFKAPAGFWDVEENAKNCILATLDTMPGFKIARDKNDIKTMADLYRKYAIKYKAANKTKYKCDGQQAFFYEKGGLNGLMSHPREYLKKTGSPASILRFVLPKLIDLRNPDALDPLEVEDYYWNDPNNAKYHIFLALDTIPGFKEARENNDIKIMTDLYRKYAIKYKAANKTKYKCDGQQAFFYEKGGLNGLMSHPREYLKKTSSPASMLRFVLPKLIDDSNPDAFKSFEVEYMAK
jgi:ubiquitin